MQVLYSQVVFKNERPTTSTTALIPAIFVNQRPPLASAVYSSTKFTLEELKITSDAMSISCLTSNDIRTQHPAILARLDSKTLRDYCGLGHDFRHYGTTVDVTDDMEVEVLFNGASAILSDFNVPGSTFGFAAWVYPTATNAMIFNAEDVRQVFIEADGRLRLFNGAPVNNLWSPAPFDLLQNTWTHLAVLWSVGNPMKAYKNGKEFIMTNSNVGTSWGTTYSMCFGAAKHGIAPFYSGRMKDIILFQKMIDETDVKRVMCGLNPI